MGDNYTVTLLAMEGDTVTLDQIGRLCGTDAGYQQHRRRGESCDRCRAAHRETGRRNRADRRARGRRPASVPELIVDVLETHDRWLSRPTLIDYVQAIRPTATTSTIVRSLARLITAGRVDRRYVYVDVWRQRPEYRLPRETQ